jgi:hypothetical protein
MPKATKETEERTMPFDKVRADNFFKDDGDKVKVNWLLYEYANNLYMDIAESPKLARYRKRHTEEDIVAFCVYFSKRLRKSIHDSRVGISDGVLLDGRYVYEFYPDNSYEQTQLLLESAMSAWKEQLNTCVGCGNKCLMDGYELTGMFDNLEKTGWPT